MQIETKKKFGVQRPLRNNESSWPIFYISNTTQPKPATNSVQYGDAFITFFSDLEPEAPAVLSPASATTQTRNSNELTQEYHDLGEALNQLVLSDLDDDWRVEKQVYKSACVIAAHLIAESIPAPHVFTNGPHSVVFSWSTRAERRYMTISKSSISILVSTHERIERRSEYQLAQLGWPTNPSSYLAAIWSKGPDARSLPAEVDPANLRGKL